MGGVAGGCVLEVVWVLMERKIWVYKGWCEEVVLVGKVFN